MAYSSKHFKIIENPDTKSNEISEESFMRERFQLIEKFTSIYNNADEKDKMLFRMFIIKLVDELDIFFTTPPERRHPINIDIVLDSENN